jgi:hypothetical protein
VSSAAALTLTSNAITHFILRLTERGEPAWATIFEDDALMHTQAIASSRGYLVAVGQFDGTASFGSSAQQLSASRSPSTFITRLAP